MCVCDSFQDHERDRGVSFSDLGMSWSSGQERKQFELLTFRTIQRISEACAVLFLSHAEQQKTKLAAYF